MLAHLDIRVFVMEGNAFARSNISLLLGRDRRTRVVGQASSPFHLMVELRRLRDEHQPEPQFILFDTSYAEHRPEMLRGWLEAVKSVAGDARILCLADKPDRAMALAACDAGAGGFMTRESVRLSIGSTIVYALNTGFVVTNDVALRLQGVFDNAIFRAEVLPSLREYPALTQRIEEALRLCVIKGLPADVAADEMGLSTSTVRSYVKEGYRILESYDDTIYPNDLSPQERAFMRYTALDAA